MSMQVSIIIGNYNYGRFVADAIESALAQSYGNVEVIVVDDGSTDQSCDVIKAFGARITAIFLEHRGQCASLNRGFAASRGDAVLFLDADDCLLPDAIDVLIRPLLDDPRVVQSQGYLDVVDESLKPLESTIPRRLSPSGDYRKRTLKRGLGACQRPYTSGNLWRRRYLETVFPLPEVLAVEQYGYLGPDGYLQGVAQLVGGLASVPMPVAKYRVHGGNRWHGATPFGAKALRAHLAKIAYQIDYLSHWARKLGYEPDDGRWRKWKRNWADNLAAFTLSLLDPAQPPPNFNELIFSPFMSGTTHRAKAVWLALVFAMMWCAPKTWALRSSQRMLVNKLPHLATRRT